MRTECRRVARPLAVGIPPATLRAMPIEVLSHVGICVSDLERSIRFYRDGLGFGELHRMEVKGEEAERLLELEPVVLNAVYLERDGTVIELLEFAAPGHEGRDAPRPMNRVGLTHLSLRVSGFDDVLADVEAHGGHVLRDTETRREAWGMAVAFVTDPDGLRIELLEAPGDPTRLPGS